jgi:hypothetical protein
LLDQGDYVVEIGRDFAAPAKLVGRYPGHGWSAELEPTKTGVRISAHGNAEDRLLVLQ